MAGIQFVLAVLAHGAVGRWLKGATLVWAWPGTLARDTMLMYLSPPSWTSGHVLLMAMTRIREGKWKRLEAGKGTV